MKRVVVWMTGLAAALGSAGAFAHALNLFVHEEGSAVKGSAYFTGGVPAKNAEVQVKDAAGNVVGTATTDAEGNFTYTGVRPAGVLTFIASTQDGHRAESKLESGGRAALPANGDTGAVNSPPASTGQATSSDRQLGAIQEAIDRLEKRIWLRDIIGGIGYIFGVAGLWALWKSQQGRNDH